MPSEKLTRILKARSPFDDDVIARMSEADGWAWVYANAVHGRSKQPRICFTGFRADHKAALAGVATAHNLDVVSSVTKDLAFLCIGANAGQAKIEKATAHGVVLLNEEQFRHMLETGQIPG